MSRAEERARTRAKLERQARQDAMREAVAALELAEHADERDNAEAVAACARACGLQAADWREMDEKPGRWADRERWHARMRRARNVSPSPLFEAINANTAAAREAQDARVLAELAQAAGMSASTLARSLELAEAEAEAALYRLLRAGCVLHRLRGNGRIVWSWRRASGVA